MSMNEYMWTQFIDMEIFLQVYSHANKWDFM